MKNSIGLAGISLLLAVSSLSAATHYASLESTNPTPPYTTWATAATTIQDAVDAAATNDVVLVANGVYSGGVLVTIPLRLLSINGPQFTVINGGGATCVSLWTDGASLSGFTLTNGGGGVRCISTRAFVTNCTIVGNSARGYGGGAYGGTLYNCILSGNNAYAGKEDWGWAYGGGAYGGTLYNCVLIGNSAPEGGGACACTLYNCTVTGNSAVNNGINGGFGGGVSGGTLYNCIVYFNTAPFGANWGTSGGNLTLNYCCSTPLPTNGVGNMGSAPSFINDNQGNVRLRSKSPCIDAGNNAYVTSATDLDGRPRVVGGTVDMGAYEFQGPFDQWLQFYRLPTDGSADFIDSDGDGLNNWQECICGTDPTNRLSVLRMISVKPTATSATLTWQSVAGTKYFLEGGANLAAPFTLLATNIPGQLGTTTYTDTNLSNAGKFFYRVGVRNY